MLKKTLLTLPLLFLVNCGGGSSSNENNETQQTPETTQATIEESVPKVLTSIEKVTKASEALSISVTPINGIVDVVSGEDKIGFNNELYALSDNANQFAVISIGSNELEELEVKEGLVFKSQNVLLPNFHKGYRNIVIDDNTTDVEIEGELTLLFDDSGVPVMSYVPSSMEKNSTIRIEGDSNLFTCTSKNNQYEVTAEDGLLTLPSDKDGHYLCLDQYSNQAFDYNVSIEKIEEVAGSLYTYDPKKLQGASVKIYDDIHNQVDIESIETRLKASNVLGENDSLKLEIFYKSENSTSEPVKTVAGRVYLLEAGTYLLSFLMTSPQNSNINQEGDLSPLKVIPETIKTIIKPN